MLLLTNTAWQLLKYTNMVVKSTFFKTFEIHTCTAYITNIRTVQSMTLVAECYFVSVWRTQRTDPACFSFGCLRQTEYDGVQRIDLTSTQGQTLVFVFTVIFTIILP